MASLALRNLFHERVRLAVTLTGISFALVLMVVEAGLFLGFTTTTSAEIDHSGADLWVVSHGTRNVDTATSFPSDKRFQVMPLPGVRQVRRLIVHFSPWKRPDGAEESVEVVGFDLKGGLGGPWNVVEGNVADLAQPDAVMIDELYRQKLGITHLGQLVEINKHMARVVGFTRGIRSFTTSPLVYTSFRNAMDYCFLHDDQTNYLLVEAQPGVNLNALKRMVRSRLSDVDVYTSAEFSRRTQNYWMFTTGAGVALILAALLGLVVGVVVVAQTIYATTMDHLREYGTLKAMGASNGFILRVVLGQAALSGVMGYVLGISLSLVLVIGSRDAGAAILLPLPMAAVMFAITLLMCLTASLVSINTVLRLDPAMVFRN